MLKSAYLRERGSVVISRQERHTDAHSIAIGSTDARVSERGFTMVELVVVLLIVGLLIGGILKAQEVMINARITATISAAKSFDQAITTFRDSFNAWPGDMMTATTRLPNCDGTALTQCFNGGTALGTAGDGIVGTPGIVGNAVGAENEERVQFWRHLLAVNLISDTTPDAAIAWNAGLPSAPIGGGWRIGYNTGLGPIQAGNPAPTTNPAAGHYLELAGEPDVSALAAAAGTLPLTPTRAAQIDRKVDDGVEDTGAIIAYDAGNCFNGAVLSGYNESGQSKDCGIYFRIQL